MNIYAKLLAVQTKLRAPKGQFNAFGKYKYRNCEDILEALKPILAEEQCSLLISDSIEHIGDRYYVKAHVIFVDIESHEMISTEALAREEQDKKGMDGSQVTGASSSYARKYALNGLFAIDDTKDSDSTNTHGKDTKESKPKDTKQITPVPTETNPNIISLEQKKILFSLAGGRNDEVKKIIADFGYESSSEIERKNYDDICKRIELLNRALEESNRLSDATLGAV